MKNKIISDYDRKRQAGQISKDDLEHLKSSEGKSLIKICEFIAKEQDDPIRQAEIFSALIVNYYYRKQLDKHDYLKN
tara:strand:- start:10848 stop:11078 length:231 start_codon:yes stop_codon:yes gene_type:complete